MKKIGQLMQMQPATKAVESSSTVSRIEKRHIDRLWVKMEKIYSPSTWHKKHGASDDGTWLRGLSDLTPADIARGVARCEKSESEWPPNLPLFRQLCTAVGGEVGTPTTEAAYREACHNAHRDRNDHVWSHAVVWHAARAVGFDVLFASAEAKPVFEREYQRMIARVANGESIEEPPAPALRRLSAAPLTPHAIKAADAGIAAMRHALRGRRNA